MREDMFKVIVERPRFHRMFRSAGHAEQALSFYAPLAAAMGARRNATGSSTTTSRTRAASAATARSS